MTLDEALQAWLANGDKQPLIWEIVRRGIVQRQRVLSWHKDGLFVFCPHVLGHSPAGRHVLAFLTLPEVELAATPYDSPRRWRWFNLQDIRAAQLGPGVWYGAPRESRPPAPPLLTVDLDGDSPEERRDPSAC